MAEPVDRNPLQSQSRDYRHSDRAEPATASISWYGNKADGVYNCRCEILLEPENCSTPASERTKRKNIKKAAVTKGKVLGLVLDFSNADLRESGI